MQRILIISDSPKGTAELQQELICAGYPVLTCGGERTGVLQAVSPRPPEVLLLDTLASRLTMKELRALLHQEFSSHSPLVIALMGRDDLAHLDMGAGPLKLQLRPLRVQFDQDIALFDRSADVHVSIRNPPGYGGR